MNTILKKLDQRIALTHLSLRQERSSLISFLFHGLFEDEKQIQSQLVDPLEGLTANQFRFIIEYFLTHDYQFVTENEILDGLDTERKYLYLTFDDGYFNNFLALPILREFDVPATFFIATHPVESEKSFWWDALYRQRAKQCVSPEKILQEQNALKVRKHSEIEKYLEENFGRDILRPIGDVDRPMTSGELGSFSEDPNVVIGNHTKDHAILTNYPSNGVKDQIKGAQEALARMTGTVPKVIAYPNGNYSREVIAISKEVGLQLGVTVNPYKNGIPLTFNGSNEMELSRFTLKGYEPLETQCQLIRSDGSTIQFVKKRLRRTGVYA